MSAKKQTIFIQRRGNGYLETVDEVDGWQEARRLLGEYRLSDPDAHYFTSRRSCKAWKEE